MLQTTVWTPICMATENPYLKGTERKCLLCSLNGSAGRNEWSISKHLAFSNGSQLSNSSQKRHTLSNCKECAILHTTLQNAYPGKKSELSKDVATTLSAAINGKEETHATREILADLQPLFEKQYGHSFTNYLAHSYKLSQKKRRDRADSLTVLAEGNSMQSYKRLRLSQSFETPQAKQTRVESSAPKLKTFTLIRKCNMGQGKCTRGLKIISERHKN